MLGAIVGDVIGSRFEGTGHKSKEFELYHPQCRFTDDTVLTCAIAEWCLGIETLADLWAEPGRRFEPMRLEKLSRHTIRGFAARYPDAGYGDAFKKWVAMSDHEFGHSWGNGAAMRVSPVAYAFNSLDDVVLYAKHHTACSHDHPEAYRGAACVAAAVFLARSKKDKGTIRQYLETEFGYDLSRRLDDVRPAYQYDPSCQGSVPEAVIAFLEATDFEDAVRNAVSLGGDADTQASIAGAIAAAYYGIPPELEEPVWRYLDGELTRTVRAFNKRFLQEQRYLRPTLRSKE
jgi:ADP-ribosylglycohydrolase